MGNTKLANPAPLGLMGFGMTTILLNLHNVGYFALDGIILAMGIFYGGIAQIFAGLLEYKKGNTFGLTAFTSYGSFWLTLVAILLMPKLGLTDAPNAQFLGVYLGLWGIFTLFMFFGTLKGARVLQFVFFSLTVLFALLAIGNIAGSYVLDGVFQRGCKVRITREGEQIFEGNLASLKRFKDDVKEVKAGYECGLVFEGFDKMQELDIVEAYIMVEVPR